MLTKEPEFLMSEYHDLALGGDLSDFNTHALYRLMRTHAFTEQDVHTMLHRQILGQPGERLPCEIDDPESEDPESEDPDPVPAAPSRLRCPLYERGCKGDPLVPCREAQHKNPAAEGRSLRQAPFLPAGLPAEQRDAINLFFRGDMQPCKLLQRALVMVFLGELRTPGPIFRVSARPSADLPAPPVTGEELQQALLEQRQSVLHNRREVEAIVDSQRRSLLLFLIRSGRLTLMDIIYLIDRVVLLSDESFVPCRDDPQRNIWESSQEKEDREERLDESDGEEAEQYAGPPNTCLLCPLQVRAKLGDRAVPCVEALRMAPDPELIEKERIYDEAFKAEIRAEGGTPRVKLPLPRSWSGPEDQPGGPKDIVNLLNIRPCHLVGQVAATFLCDLIQYVLAHPEEAAKPAKDPDVRGV